MLHRPRNERLNIKSFNIGLHLCCYLSNVYVQTHFTLYLWPYCHYTHIVISYSNRLLRRVVVRQLHEVEAELENEVRKGRDLAAENRKLQRQLVEQKNQSEADRRQVSDITEQCHALQQRVKTLKRQLEEAVSSIILQNFTTDVYFFELLHNSRAMRVFSGANCAFLGVTIVLSWLQLLSEIELGSLKSPGYVTQTRLHYPNN